MFQTNLVLVHAAEQEGEGRVPLSFPVTGSWAEVERRKRILLMFPRFLMGPGQPLINKETKMEERVRNAWDACCSFRGGVGI